MELTKELYESPNKEANEKRYGLLIDQCICCGKPIKGGDKQLFVHMNTDWLAVHPSVSEADCERLTGASSQGTFHIGADCAKKMKGFTIKNN